MSNTTKLVTSAVVISPPESLWEPIQHIRKQHDKAYDRWMPHINLLYPFLPEDRFGEAKEKFTEALQSIPPFKITFAEMDHFDHGKNATLFLKSHEMENLVMIQSLFQKCFPFCDDLGTKSPNGFHPHLTLGQFPTLKISSVIRDLMKGWKPIEFLVDKIYIISRTDKEPFSIKQTIELKKQLSMPIIQVKNNIMEKKEVPESGNPQFILYRPHEPVGSRIKHWIASKNRSILPKTKEKLAKSLLPFCTIPLKANVDFILSQLEKDGLIRSHGTEVKYLEKKAIIANFAQLTTLNPLERQELELVYHKCLEWLKHCLPSPKTTDALRHSLEQLCWYKRTTFIEDELHQLVDEGFIFIKHDGTVQYLK